MCFKITSVIFFLEFQNFPRICIPALLQICNIQILNGMILDLSEDNERYIVKVISKANNTRIKHLGQSPSGLTVIHLERCVGSYCSRQFFFLNIGQVACRAKYRWMTINPIICCCFLHLFDFFSISFDDKILNESILTKNRL